MYQHGGNIYQIAKQYNIDHNKIIDYSSNINPLGMPVKLKKEIKNNLHFLEKYPDINYSDLSGKFAKLCNVSTENILVGNGAVALIYSYMQALNPSKVLIAAPTFSEYERGLLQLNAEIDYFELLESDNFSIDLQKLNTKIKNNYDLVVICNPNNPTGKVISSDVLEKIVDSLYVRGTQIFLDESFIDFLPEVERFSAVSLTSKYQNLFILRSCTKYLAIPGLRAGYAVCSDSDLILKMKSLQVPWQVNSLVNLSADFLLQDKSFKQKTLQLINKEREYLINGFEQLEWLKVYPADANFILCKIKHELNTEELQSTLIKKNILIRNAENFKFLNNKYIRFAVKNRKNNKALLSALSKIYYKKII